MMSCSSWQKRSSRLAKHPASFAMRPVAAELLCDYGLCYLHRLAIKSTTHKRDTYIQNTESIKFTTR
jgi:hypothetical protein